MNKRRLSITLVMMTTLVLLASVVPVLAIPTKGSVIHIVRRGETLYSIARRYGVDMWTIARANGITNPNRIYVGQRLVIPTDRPPAGTVHIVQRGETLYSIALRYGVSMWAIARANGIANLNRIYVGQRLVIPGTVPPPLPPAPTPAPMPGPWSGEYFDNVTLAGSAYVTRDDESINFNWGWGPPAGGMPTNSFSVRWTGTFSFAEGTYRFYAKVDDGVRVHVDGERIINGWRDGGLRTYTADRALAAGDHTIQVEYYDRIQVARVYFWWRQLSGATPTPGPSPTPATTPAPGAGWFGQFYNGEGLGGSPVATRYDPWIGFDWGTGSPMPGVYSDHFSVRWTMTAYMNADHYRFCATADDGVRILVDGDVVLNEWHAADGLSYCSAHWVASGNHEIVVEYFEGGGNALIHVWWEPH